MTETNPTPSSSSEPPATTEPVTSSPTKPPEYLAATVAPIKWWGKSRVYPDLYNHMPSRMVTVQEAQLRAWVYYYEGEVCSRGHRAPRWVSIPKRCVDCERAKKNLDPIGHKAAPKTKQARPVGSKRGVLDATDHAFMTALSELGDFDKACEKAGIEAAQMRVRVASVPKLRLAVNDLQRRVSPPGPTPEPEKPKVFEWSDEARAKFVEAYVDTGDIASARDAIGVTPSEYYRELDRNPAFGTAVKSAESLAMRALEERAIQLSLKGNDKLLQKLLAAKMPEQYSERVRLDVKQETTHKLDDRALNARLASLLQKHRDIYDAEFTELQPGRETPAIGGPGGAGPAEVKEQA